MHAARSSALSALRLPTLSPSGARDGISAAAALEALRTMPSGEALLASLIAPLRSPHVLAALGVRPLGGVLLHGPAGCGKTTLARYVAAAAAANFVEVPAAALISSHKKFIFNDPIRPVLMCPRSPSVAPIQLPGCTLKP